jgi:NAD(P)-dependent dehydrogenase (short-subunit alcohol dehydrogenase family)
MKDFRGKLAVVTGGRTGMGRSLAEQLTAEGCHVAICDVAAENMAETERLCASRAPSGIRVSTHLCDVSDEQQVLAFRDNAPVTAARAATIILDGVRNDAWRILVGDDALALDRLVRETPDSAYESSFLERLHAQGHLQLLD